jgi:hypothetical protein
LRKCFDRLWDEADILIDESVNHYTTYIIRARDPSTVNKKNMWDNFLPDLTQDFTDKDGKQIAPEAGLSWCRPVPWGFGKLLTWLYENYGFDIYV